MKSTTLRKLNHYTVSRIYIAILLTGLVSTVTAQDNSPYSRYGLGDTYPNSNAANRGLGGISAAYNDYFNINYNNPASYSFFQATNEPNSRKLASGRAVLNVGVDAQTRTLIDRNIQNRFTTSNIVFSNVTLGMPLRKNWGMVLGLRPLHRINYKMERNERIRDHRTNLPIDSGRVLYEGEGGLSLASVGTGVKFKTGKSAFVSFGANAGYIFGKQDYSTRLWLLNDSTMFAAGNKQQKAGVGGLYFDAGMQYQFKVTNKLYMGIGAYGNMSRKLTTTKDVINETFVYDANSGYTSRDSIYTLKNIKGNVYYPASITTGLMLQKPQTPGSNQGGWLAGLDFTYNDWNGYRNNGIADTAVKSNWQVKLGAEFNPARKNNYLSLVSYRFGAFTGPEYIYLRKTTMPVYGVSFGLGLPLINYNGAMAGYQVSQLNLAFEYVKRGNNQNIIKENLFRVSAGFSLSDLWFIKRRYVD